MTERHYPHLVRDYPVMIHALGPDGKLNLGATFDMLQDIAGIHAAELGVGVPQLNSLGITWVLSRIILKFNSFPDSSDIVCLTTWPSGVRKLFATRQFEMISKLTGECYAVASSFWLMLKLDSMRPVLPSSVVPAANWLRSTDDMNIPVFFSQADKLPQNAGENPVCTLIGQSKIDSNCHVNNTHYANFTQDWLTAKVGCFTRITEIQINFNYGLKCGNSITCSGEITAEDGFRVVGFSDDERNTFAACGKWRKI